MKKIKFSTVKDDSDSEITIASLCINEKREAVIQYSNKYIKILRPISIYISAFLETDNIKYYGIFYMSLKKEDQCVE